MSSIPLYSGTDWFRPYPSPSDVFAADVAQHARLLLPLASIDLSRLSPDLNETIHFIQSVEPYNGVVGEGSEGYFNHYCRPNWVAFQYDDTGKCEIKCDFEFFGLPRLETNLSRSDGEQNELDELLVHYDDVHSGYAAAKEYFQSHGVLHNQHASRPFSDQDRFAMLWTLGGPSEQFSCNWPAIGGMPLSNHRQSPLPLTEDGREFLYVGELTSYYYVWSKRYGLGCVLLLFYDPDTQIALTTFDWS